MENIDIIMNIFEGLVASAIWKIIDKLIENKDRFKEKFQEILLDISNISQKKPLCNITHPNTPCTWTGNGFGDH